MNAPKIRDVKPLPAYRLLVTFTNGKQRVYDCGPLLSRNAFRALRDEAYFKSVTVDSGGYGVAWDDEADLSEYELWTGSELDPAEQTPLQLLLQ